LQVPSPHPFVGVQLSRLHGRGFASETDVASSLIVLSLSPHPPHAIATAISIAIIIVFMILSPLCFVAPRS
jgi:hypothetical protein